VGGDQARQTLSTNVDTCEKVYNCILGRIKEKLYVYAFNIIVKQKEVQKVIFLKAELF
jgi:hypothetical protein